MMLIGQYDSPFTRRVGITMRCYGMDFDHNTWSIFGNADELSKINPLIRVPTLVLDSGEMLIETAAIIDYLDSQVPEGKRLSPQTQPARFLDQRIVSMASGISDMAVRLFYEVQLHDKPSQDYVNRITRQLTGALQWLEKERALHKGETWFGGAMSQADIAVTCALKHLSQSHPAVGDLARYPALRSHCAHFEAQAVFKDISQEFIPPT